MTAIRVLLISALLMLSSGCWMKKKPVIPVPAAPVPAAPMPAAPSPSPAASVPQQPAPAPQPAAPVVTEPAKPSPFPPVTTTPARPRPTPVAPPVAPVPAPAPAPTPSLGAILTADQRRQLDIAYQSDLRQANAVLSGLSGRSLTPDQNDTVSRARAFIRQAAQYHDRDLTTAAELARRARVLTQDLAGALK